MSWMRSGDTAGNHPVVLAVLEHPDADDRHLNEVFGFVMRCALHSAANFTDYLVHYGTAVSIAGSKSRADELLELAVFAGYFTKVTADGRPAFMLIDDPDFIHIRTKEEIDWEKTRDRDRKDPALVVPVRLRDGDACRYCNRVVMWTDNKSGRGGTFDHLVPGQAATIDTYVVACRNCNSILGDRPYEERLEYLLTAPPNPYFTRRSVQAMRQMRWVKDNNVTIPDPTPGQKYAIGEFIPGPTKISALHVKAEQKTEPRDIQPRGTEPVSASSGPLGPDDSQSPVDPAELPPAPAGDSAGPSSGMADGTQSSVRPAAESTDSGPRSGMADDIQSSVRPALSPDDRPSSGMAADTPSPVRPGSSCPSPGPLGPDDNQSPVDPAGHHTTEKQPAPPGETPIEQSLRNPPQPRAGNAAMPGSGRVGSGRTGSGQDGQGRERRRRPAPAACPPALDSKTLRRRKR